MQSKIKICKTDFLQIKKMWNQKYLKIGLTDFLKILVLNVIYSNKSTVKISS